MTRVLVTREELTRQIDKQLLPDGKLRPNLYIDGVLTLPDDELDPVDTALKEYKPCFTYMEYQIFRELYRCIKFPVHITTFAGLLHRSNSTKGYRASFELANGVAVHIKSIRKKIANHRLPFEINTVRGYHSYKLLPK